jgi:hypothetical protein
MHGPYRELDELQVAILVEYPQEFGKIHKL